MPEQVTLRPVREDDLPSLRTLTQDPQVTGEFEQYGWYAPRLTVVHRIEAATETGNIAEQKALERAGFTREGVLRGIRWRGGAWRDEVLYSILRTDPAA